MKVGIKAPWDAATLCRPRGGSQPLAVVVSTSPVHCGIVLHRGSINHILTTSPRTWEKDNTQGHQHPEKSSELMGLSHAPH